MDLEKVMKKFIDYVNESKLDRAESLIKKYSRNKGNELAIELISIGYYYGSLQLYDYAIFCFDLSQQISKNIRLKEKAKNFLANALNLRAHQYITVNLSKKAEDDYIEALSITPNLSFLHNNYGILLRKLGRFEEAQEQYKHALELKSDDYEVHHNYAILLIKMGNLQDAEKHLIKSLKYDYFPAKLTYSLILMTKSEYKNAENLLLDLLTTHPTDPRILGNLGVIQFAQGNYEESIQYFLQAKDQFLRIGDIKNSEAVEGYINWVTGTKMWGSGDIETSSQFFRAASEKFHQEDFEEQSLATYLLSLLIPFDRDILNALNSKNLQELKNAVRELYFGINGFWDIDLPRLPHFQILYYKLKYVKILYQGLHFKDHDIKELEKSKLILRQFNFSGDLQLINSLDNFLQELRNYTNLEEIPAEQEEKLLKMIQPFFLLYEQITQGFSDKAKRNSAFYGESIIKRIDTLERTVSKMMDNNRERIISEIQNSREIIIKMTNNRYREIIDHFEKLNHQQLLEFQKLIEEEIQNKIEKIEEKDKKEEAIKRWDQLKRGVNITVNVVGYIASAIQIYQFIDGGQINVIFS